MAESFKNLDDILRGWAKDKVQKGLAETLNGFEKQEEEEMKPVSFRKDSEKYSSSLSRQPSRTIPSTKLVVVGREPLLYLEFNKSYG